MSVCMKLNHGHRLSAILSLCILFYSGSLCLLGCKEHSEQPLDLESEETVEGRMIGVTDEDFDSFAKIGLVLVDFWSPNCVGAQKMESALSRLSSKYQGKITFLQVNVAESPKLVAKYRIDAIARFLLLHDGEIIKEMPNVTTELELDAALEVALVEIQAKSIPIPRKIALPDEKGNTVFHNINDINDIDRETLEKQQEQLLLNIERGREEERKRALEEIRKESQEATIPTS